MAAGADGYTRAVTTLKVLLPLGALGLLSTLFLFSGQVDPSQSIPYAELGVEQLAREQRVSAPYFAGVTEGGAAITLTGDTATPDPDTSGLVTVQNLSARFEADGDRVIDATAPLAALDSRASVVELRGGAQLVSSDGVRVVSDTVRIDLGQGSLETLGPVDAVGPFGSLRADRMAVTQPAPGIPHTFVFEGGVKLVYQDAAQ
ncbi:MAG: hypothetical protein AAGF78_09030 [Pseudomonadota bacterium]